MFRVVDPVVGKCPLVSVTYSPPLPGEKSGEPKIFETNTVGTAITTYWNDRRSRRVFLCFYSAIFQLASTKFQTFAYNSRTVGSSYTKFGQQLGRGNRSRDFGFRTRKPPRKFGVKSGLSQQRFKYGKKYFIWLYVSRYPFIPTNPLLAAIRFISFFFLFFLPNFCTLCFS